MELFIDDGGDVSTGDYANWAGAVIHLKPGATEKPESWTLPVGAGAADRIGLAGDAAHQRAAHHRRHARTSVPVPDPGHRRGPAEVHARRACPPA